MRPKLPSKYLIYALSDPRDGATRYVGKSSSGMRRPREHRTPSVFIGGRTHHDRWLQELWHAGYKCQVRVLEFVTRDTLRAAELRLIAEYLKRGHALTNHLDRGDNLGHVTSELTCLKLSIAGRGKKRSAATRFRMSIAKRGTVASVKIRELQKQRFIRESRLAQFDFEPLFGFVQVSP